MIAPPSLHRNGLFRAALASLLIAALLALAIPAAILLSRPEPGTSTTFAASSYPWLAAVVLSPFLVLVVIRLVGRISRSLL
jgi:hypothetical protein